MPALILLNGPPAAGKSTLAARLVEARPLSLDLDLDVVRAQLGGWLDRPEDSGQAARSLGRAMATTHLTSGFDVVVPQFLGRTGFIEQLEQVADSAGASFVEILLDLPRNEAIEAFEIRRRQPESRIHRLTNELVERSESDDPVGEMYDRLQRMRDERPNMRPVEVLRGRVDATYQALIEELRRLGVEW